MTKEREQPEPQPESMSLDQVAHMAKETALRDGFHLPTVIADGSNQTVVIQVTEFASTHAERASQMFIAGALLAREGRAGHLRRVFFVSEAWISVGREGQAPVSPPSQDPDRKEVLVISSYEPTTQHVEMKLFEMMRDDEGALQDLQDLATPESDQARAESPLLEAFAYGYSGGGAPH